MTKLFLLSGVLPVLAPGEAVAKLGVGKLMQTPGRRHTEVPPHVLTAPEVQLLNCARTRLETLKRK